jgi:hypothetical protein
MKRNLSKLLLTLIHLVFAIWPRIQRPNSYLRAAETPLASRAMLPMTVLSCGAKHPLGDIYQQAESV